MIDKFMKWLDHNRYFALTILVSTIGLAYTGCGAVKTTSPTTGSALTGSELSMEFNQASAGLEEKYEANLGAIRELMNANESIIRSSDRMSEDYDVAFDDLRAKQEERSALFDSILGAVNTAVPGAGAALGASLPILSPLILGGVIVDNRRKNGVIKKLKNGG